MRLRLGRSACAALILFIDRFPLLRAYHLDVFGDGQITRSGPNLIPSSSLKDSHAAPPAASATTAASASVEPWNDLRRAVDVMQSAYFELWVGKWPTAIDWTAAVMNTHIVATVTSLSKALYSSKQAGVGSEASQIDWSEMEIQNEINRYFAQNTAYYFGEDSFALRNEAFDDMLWVVLGWLDALRFIRSHSDQHRRAAANVTRAWHGSQFTAAFAHRARVFYDLAAQGWDTKLCGGGMVWNPVLEPYKNAITNELYMAASVGMYLYHPGDNNSSPFAAQRADGTGDDNDDDHGNVAGHSDDYDARFQPALPHDPSYLSAAIQAYEWFKSSNMTNEQGLVVDGFHITGWNRNGSIGTGKCDARNEMVYTYNQAVVLSALRGLWESTGDRVYLEDAHELARNAIRATGWDMELATASHDLEWAGLGRAGILEESCDAKGHCSQDGQTFKGIFFHHLTLFCEPLPLEPRSPGMTHAADNDLARLHRQSCSRYARWVVHNARAAIATRDAHGKFGMWWGSGRNESVLDHKLPNGAIDYRNDPRRHAETHWPLSRPDQQYLASSLPLPRLSSDQIPIASDDLHGFDTHTQDANDRGRGRTVETQGGAVAVLRGAWELLMHAT